MQRSPRRSDCLLQSLCCGPAGPCKSEPLAVCLWLSQRSASLLSLLLLVAAMQASQDAQAMLSAACQVLSQHYLKVGTHPTCPAGCQARPSGWLSCSCAMQELTDLLRHPSEGLKFRLHLSLLTLAQACPELCTALVQRPQAALQHLEAAAITAQQQLLQSGSVDASKCSVKQSVQALLTPLPLPSGGGSFQLARPAIGAIGVQHVGRLVTVSSVVVRRGPVKVLETQRLYECKACHHQCVLYASAQNVLGALSTLWCCRFVVDADLELFATVDVPKRCPSSGDGPCKGTAFEQLPAQLHTEHQEIRLREGSQAAQEACAPHGITAILLGAQVDSCHPGGVCAALCSCGQAPAQILRS